MPSVARGARDVAARLLLTAATISLALAVEQALGERLAVVGARGRRDGRRPARVPADAAATTAATGIAPDDVAVAMAQRVAAPPEVEVLGADRRAAREDHRALDDVLDLAHVARPVVLAQLLHAVGCEARRRHAHLARELRDEVVRERPEVVEAIAQRRQVDREHVEPVVEVLAELALLDHLLEVAVRRRHEANVDLHGLVAADALELALLQRAEQLDLHLHREVADLVEEQRAAVGELEAAAAALHRAREAALLVAEQLGLEDAGRERRAVDAHERLLLARRVDVDRVRDELLAGAGLAAQEHRRRHRRDLADLVEHLAQGRRVTDDVAEVELAVQLLVQIARVLGELRGEALVLGREVEALERVLEDAAHFLGRPTAWCGCSGRPGRGWIASTSTSTSVNAVEDDADRVRLALAHLAQELDARHLRHPLVGDDDGDLPTLVSRICSASAPPDAVRMSNVFRKLNRNASRLSLFVVDHQDGVSLRGRAPGSSGSRRRLYLNHM